MRKYTFGVLLGGACCMLSVVGITCAVTVPFPEKAPPILAWGSLLLFFTGLVIVSLALRSKAIAETGQKQVPNGIRAGYVISPLGLTVMMAATIVLRNNVGEGGGHGHVLFALSMAIFLLGGCLIAVDFKKIRLLRRTNQ